MNTITPPNKLWLTKARLLFVAGIVVMIIVIAIGDILNPRGHRGVSVFVDTLEVPLLIISFVLCILSPFFSQTVWPQRLWHFVLAPIGYAAILVLVMFVSMAITGLPID
jgi:hypothetical protein